MAKKFIIFSLYFILFFLNINLCATNQDIILKLFNNNILELKFQNLITDELKMYIESSVAFQADFKILLKKKIHFFLIKDKTLKEVEKKFKFNFDIVRNKYVVSIDKKIIFFNDSKEFYKFLTTVKLKNFFLNLKNYQDLYLEIYVDLIPIKGSFNIQDLYILGKIKKFHLEKQIILDSDLFYDRK